MKTKQDTVAMIAVVLDLINILASIGDITDSEVEDLEFFERRLKELKDRILQRIEK